MLEHWYKEKRTLVDFRRGPLGPYFDGLAAHLRAKGYTRSGGRYVLGKSCLFNAFLIEHGVSRCKELSESLVEAFMEACHSCPVATGFRRDPKEQTRRALKHLFAYLVEIRAFTPPKPKPVLKPYTWLLDPFVQHLREERGLLESVLKYRCSQLSSFLEPLGNGAARERFKTLTAMSMEKLLRDHFRKSTSHPSSLSITLREFLHYCARHLYTQADFSSLVPSLRSYRHASLPKGMEDSRLESMLKSIPRDTAGGARDYAIILIMMAYGIRGISAAQLLLDDIDWHRSRIRIRACKGGKEVVLPLVEAAGEAVVQYLKHRRTGTPYREVFLSVKAPFRPMNSMGISTMVRRYLVEAGVKTAGSGSRTLRHSWAIRALANDSPIKSIADVLGHRCIDTTFIYAKADLNSLREVALPWPGKD